MLFRSYRLYRKFALIRSDLDKLHIFVKLNFMKEEKLMKKFLAVAGSLMLAASVLMTGCGGGGGDKKAADANKEWKPTKDVKVIIAYKAGSGTDTGARLLLNNEIGRAHV